jgi:UDP-N-acetylglucosamine--N-acetylmuramyl-(pentapeptide) pyrophosphoryl-undecaprenol N-acetylglucosamine transferase
VRVLIAGGGTGGHLFPGVAVAEAFRTRNSTVEILFVGTGNRMEVSTLSKKGFDHVSITAEGLKGRGLWRQMRSLLKIPVAVWQALRIIRRFVPDIIIGLGGYASGPVALAARSAGKRVVIHEQNILPGLTNRIAAHLADRVCLSFPDDYQRFKPSKTIVTGNPVRRELLAARGEKEGADSFKVLIVGGSQGAHAINGAVIKALDHLKGLARMVFVHQTGAKDAAWVKEAYSSRGIRAEVEPFFVDMATAYADANLVVCRAGATTVSELMVLGKPAVFIPFPFAANNHQELNARYVADAGGAEVLLERDLSGSALAGRLDDYMANPNMLKAMEKRVRTLARPDAADAIVDECCRLSGLGG